jgi:organic hydroperoxide reductase OsmC/OhrA
VDSKAHRYQARIEWSGSTGVGWEGYDRAHRANAPPAQQELILTTGEEKGDPRQLNPEQLVVIAAASCQMLWFLHLAAKARIDVVAYADDSLGEMPLNAEPVRIERISLRPRITIRGQASEDRVRKLCETAHRHCNVANSLTSEVTIGPTVDFVPAENGGT